MAAVYRFEVQGRVQGVGFRAATEREARRLGLRGWVRNRADGAVEGCASGEAPALAALRSWLAQGPAAARVDVLSWHADATAVLPDVFEVRR